MPFSDARDLSDSMGRVPPLHVSMAMLAGFKRPEESEDMTPEDFKSMRAMAEAANG